VLLHMESAHHRQWCDLALYPPIAAPKFARLMVMQIPPFSLRYTDTASALGHPHRYTGASRRSLPSVRVTGPNMARTPWVIVTFDTLLKIAKRFSFAVVIVSLQATDGEVIFAMASILTHQDFQRSTKYELRVFPTSPSVAHERLLTTAYEKSSAIFRRVSLLVIQGHYSVIATSE
jgi:hypothetical protein